VIVAAATAPAGAALTWATLLLFLLAAFVAVGVSTLPLIVASAPASPAIVRAAAALTALAAVPGALAVLRGALLAALLG